MLFEQVDPPPPSACARAHRPPWPQFPGFAEVRMVPGRSDIAFIEYTTDAQGAQAKGKLNGPPSPSTFAVRASGG